MDELYYQLGLTLVPNIGCVHAKILLEKYGSARAVFNASLRDLNSVEGVGTRRAKSIKAFTDFSEAEKEIKFIRKYGIQPLFSTDPNYPARLLNCYDSPPLLYFKGEANLNNSKIISIIGTRNHSDYGKQLTEDLVTEISFTNATIVSGLAFGIDSIAHKASIKNRLPTIAVLAHGLDQIYPREHTTLAKDIVKHGGGLLTEFRSYTKPDKHQFPARNRIVAGMSDATVVVETGIKGGSMITADLANSYNRDVFAFPGKTSDHKSAGCNLLIRHNKAILLGDASHLAESMNWIAKKTNSSLQKSLFIEFTEPEKEILAILMQKNQTHIDELNRKVKSSSSVIAAAILNLELQNVIVSLPGKLYQLT